MTPALIDTCPQCGSNDVHIAAWIHANPDSHGNTIIISSGPDGPSAGSAYWCEACEAHQETLDTVLPGHQCRHGTTTIVSGCQQCRDGE